MQKSLFIISITCVFAVLFYPTTSNSNSTGSPGGRTGSPMDNGNCASCHNNPTPATGSSITTNIPATGYIPGSFYTITANINSGTGGLSLHGFEVTCEEDITNTKAGTFFITDASTTQLVNNGNAVTHTASGNSLSTWNFDWQAPSSGTGNVTFYAAFIEAGYPQGNSGDIFSSHNLTVSEALVNGTINLSTKNDFIFNPTNKTIESQRSVSIYDINGKLILKTDNHTTNIKHLNSGIYILKSNTKRQKIILE